MKEMRSKNMFTPVCCSYEDNEQMHESWLTVKADISACKFGSFKDGNSKVIPGRSNVSNPVCGYIAPKVAKQEGIIVTPLCCKFKDASQSATVLFKWLTTVKDVDA